MAAQIADLKKNFALAGVELKTALGKGLTNAALIVERDYKVRLTKGGHVASGLLRASASHRLIDPSVGYPFAQIGPLADYGKELELGSAPHHVPIEDLITWVRRKGLAGEGYASNRSGRSFKKGVEKSIAYEIQKHIESYGTMPHPALLPALLSNKEAIFKAIAAPMKAELAKGRGQGAT